MNEMLVKISLFYFCLSVISCTSQPDVNNEIKKNVTSSTNIQDSLTKEKKILACDTPYKSVDILIINDATTDDNNSVSFSSQMDANGQVLSGGKPIDTSISIFYPYAEPTYKVSKKALHYLAEYVDEKCVCKNPANDDDTQIFGVYYFKLMQGEQTKTCYVYLRNIDYVIEYFQGLKVWLEDSKYKSEFKGFFKYINRQIRKMEEEKGRRK